MRRAARNARAWRSCWAALAVLLAPAAGAQEQPEAELAAVRDRIESLEARLAADARRRDDGLAELRRLELVLAEAGATVSGLDAEIERLAARERDLDQSASAVRGRMGEDRALLAEQVRMSYRTGQQEIFKLLLSQESPADLGRMLTYYDYLNRARSERLDAASGELAEIVRLTGAAQTARLEQARLRDDRAGEVSRLQSARAERQRHVDELQAAMSASGDEIERLRAEETRLAELVAELAALLEGFPVDSEAPFASLRGQLSWPVEGRLAADYGQLREGGPLRWNGVVLDADAGTSVRAVYHGRVVFADWLPGLGLLMILDHGEQYMSLYGHNEVLLREPGDWVRPGEVIAEVGDTGGRREPALYFEIRHAGEPVNPHAWVR